MKIQLNNTEILDAIYYYVNNMGINVEGKTLSIEFTQGRKNGLSADISIDEATSDAATDNPLSSETTCNPLTVVVSPHLNKVGWQPRPGIMEMIDAEESDKIPEPIDGTQSIFGS